MTILILGVVYWFWTQNQYIQRKLNLLDNIVFEIKTQIQKGDTPPLGTMLPPVDMVSEGTSKYPPAPSSELGDDEDLLNEEIDDDIAYVPSTSSPTLKINDDLELPSMPEEIAELSVEHHDDDSDLAAALQPGGVGSGVKETPEADTSAKGNVLEGMTLKELQRLAEQKGINTTRMRKPALIEAIRAHSRPSPFEVQERSIELS
jgi:hypothetical protein